MQIILHEVCKLFQGRAVLHNLEAVFYAGQITMIAGANGSGKSTLLKLAGKLMNPSSGEVIVQDGGMIIETNRLRSRLAMVTPELQFYPQLTAEENLQFFLDLRGRTLSAENLLLLMERVGLPGKKLRYHFVGELSTGMRQRLKLAVLLASGADLWILDEPGANFDTEGQQLLLRESRQAAAEGRLILWATNNHQEEAMGDACIHLSGD